MKTWLSLGLAAIVCYVVYAAFFSPEEAAEETVQPIRLAEPDVVAEGPAPSTPVPEEPPLKSRSLRLDLGNGPALREAAAKAGGNDEEAWGLHQARAEALEKGLVEEADRLATIILEKHPASDAARAVQFERGREALHRFRKLGRNEAGVQAAQEARRHLTPVLFTRGAERADKERLRDTLAELARVVLLNNRHTEGVDRVYVPRSGDQLGPLCRKVFPKMGAKVTPGFICYVNGLPSPRHLRAKEPIKVPLGEASIVVVKSEFRIYFLFAGAYVIDFPVGLGKDDSTPEMTFEIGDKLKNPDWFPRPGVKIPFGDPRNILGTRWLEFKDTEAYRGFGIHGTPDPATVGKQASAGCIRLLRKDVERLFDWTPSGTKVTILR